MTKSTKAVMVSLWGLMLFGAGGAKADLIDRRVQIASQVVADRMQSAFPIPDGVIAASSCVASMRELKAGFTWGGEGSTGLLSCRTDQGWSAPVFFDVGGVNWGLQIGVQLLDSVMMFITPDGQNALEQGSIELGGEVSFAAGPVGGGPAAGVLPDAAVLVYNYAVGLYAGVTVNGLVLAPGMIRDHAVYGDGTTATDILHMPGKAAPATVQPFLQTLAQYFP
jgi:lipid-binding SYLF domain-containing protein